MEKIEKVSFWTPISYSGPRQGVKHTVFSAIEGFWYLGARRAVVTDLTKPDQAILKNRGVESSWLLTVFKIICYITVVIPLILLVAKAIFRATHEFYYSEKPEYIRGLLLGGQDGQVLCRVHGRRQCATIPRFSDNRIIECATRSRARMNNLVAVRGGERGCSMIGPTDYLQNLERPHEHLYTVDHTGRFPVVHEHPISSTERQGDVNGLMPFDDSVVTSVDSTWIPGTDTSAINAKRKEYRVGPQDLRRSLFRHPGFLEVKTPTIELREIDPRGVDLSSFKAKLFKNDVPFQLTERAPHSSDEYRLVSYLYEPGYANWQVEKGSGLFLEKHDFSQIISPITADSRGFVTLGRLNEKSGKLELIGFRIPFGWTLQIQEGCIHGDTTLNGFFLMGMTTNHSTMRTADTVFLKCQSTKRNVRMTLEGEPHSSIPLSFQPENRPHFLYRDHTEEELRAFREQIRNLDMMWNPSSRVH